MYNSNLSDIDIQGSKFDNLATDRQIWKRSIDLRWSFDFARTRSACGKPWLPSFDWYKNYQNRTHADRIVTKSNDDLRSIDIIEISRSVVKSCTFDPCRSKYDHFLFSNKNIKIVQSIVVACFFLKKPVSPPSEGGAQRAFSKKRWG